eukprot:TRINITY_DN12506_c0_g1_i1.p1 TRINITY_DN12506_c0_g1~~TRINITY_DN12506_c0_g1_i1.p1  ORF type:complete len:585 (-),score=154.66 TRINITY_DN12506_c0_g1_i1:261-2015(-)
MEDIYDSLDLELELNASERFTDDDSEDGADVNDNISNAKESEEEPTACVEVQGFEIETEKPKRSRKSESRAKVSKPKRKSRYEERDLSNLWKVRMRNDFKDELPPDPSSIFFADYVRKRVEKEIAICPWGSPSDQTPSVGSTPDMQEVDISHILHDIDPTFNYIQEVNIKPDPESVTHSEDQNAFFQAAAVPEMAEYQDAPECRDSAGNDDTMEVTEMEEEDAMQISTEDDFDDRCIDEAFRSESYTEDGKYAIIRGQAHRKFCMDQLLAHRKQNKLEISCKYRLNVRGQEFDEDTRYLLLDACSIFIYTGIIERLVKHPTIAILVPDLVLFELRLVGKKDQRQELLDIVDEIENNFEKFEPDNEELFRCSRAEVRADYVGKIANSFSRRCHIFSLDTEVEKLLKEKCYSHLTLTTHEAVLRDLRKAELRASQKDAPESTEDKFVHLMNVLRDALEVVLIVELEVFYAEQWPKVVKIKPLPSRPHWTITELLDLFNQHHEAVFSVHFINSGMGLQDVIKGMQEIVDAGDRPRDISKRIAGLKEQMRKFEKEVRKRNAPKVDSSWLEHTSRQEILQDVHQVAKWK